MPINDLGLSRRGALLGLGGAAALAALGRPALALLALDIGDGQLAVGRFQQRLARPVCVGRIGKIELFEFLAVEPDQPRAEGVLRMRVDGLDERWAEGCIGGKQAENRRDEKRARGEPFGSKYRHGRPPGALQRRERMPSPADQTSRLTSFQPIGAPTTA